METILIQIKNKENKDFLLNVLKHFKFISKIDDITDENFDKKSNLTIEDIKACFGIWKDRNITKEELRKKIWRNNKWFYLIQI